MPLNVNISKKKKKSRPKPQRPKKKAAQMTNLGFALRHLGGLGGGALGSMVGAPGVGASIGNGLGAALSRWLGSGDYSVHANSVVNKALKSSESIPAMHNNNQSVVVRHREFISEVRGSTNFNVREAFQINPGNNHLFPWLSRIASGFQEYSIKGMVYHYIPSSGNAVSGTNAALGTVILSTSYRASDIAPTSKLEVLNEYCTSESVPSEAFCHPVECDPKENPFNVQYVRTGEVPEEDSRMLYDLGITYVCVSGQQANDNVLGDLWCTYEVELKKPIVASNVTTPYRVAQVWNTVVPNSADFLSGSAILGTLPVSATNRTITFPKGAVGAWQLSFVLQMTPQLAVNWSGAPSVTNCSQRTISPDGQFYLRTVNSAGTSTTDRAFYTTVVSISDPSVAATVTIPACLSNGSAFTPSSSLCIINPSQSAT